MTDWNKYRRDSERECEARKETRRDQLSEQRRLFQRESWEPIHERIGEILRTRDDEDAAA